MVDQREGEGSSPAKVGHKDTRVTIFIQFNNSNYSLMIDPLSTVRDLRDHIIESVHPLSTKTPDQLKILHKKDGLWLANDSETL